jgi:hypothetical protein
MQCYKTNLICLIIAKRNKTIHMQYGGCSIATAAVNVTVISIAGMHCPLLHPLATVRHRT